jgi:hypothetical protein
MTYRLLEQVFIYITALVFVRHLFATLVDKSLR